MSRRHHPGEMVPKRPGGFTYYLREASCPSRRHKGAATDVTVDMRNCQDGINHTEVATRRGIARPARPTQARLAENIHRGVLVGYLAYATPGSDQPGKSHPSANGRAGPRELV